MQVPTAIAPTLTLASVLKTFTKAQTQLQKLIEQNNQIVSTKMEKVRTLTSEVGEKDAETRKAEKVLENINKLLEE